MNDPILDEIRNYRDAHAASFNYDLEAIFEDIKKRERESGRKFVSFISAEDKQPIDTQDVLDRKQVEPSPANVAKRAGK